ncbi:MAG: 30S ribosomal protein S8 [Anaerolineae bacterium]|nr:30S ribosomal protein S8 [Anaerolineae bacterium]
MTTSDPIADMLARVRNAVLVGHSHVVMPSSKMKVEIARVLKDEGYIRNYEVIHDGPRSTLRVWLKYSEDKTPVITGLSRVSRPGRREYRGRRDVPWVMSGLGIAILSTPLGVMTDQQARRSRVGGEVLCQVW